MKDEHKQKQTKQGESTLKMKKPDNVKRGYSTASQDSELRKKIRYQKPPD